jgi:uncharacterized protein YhfF
LAGQGARKHDPHIGPSQFILKLHLKPALTIRFAASLNVMSDMDIPSRFVEPVAFGFTAQDATDIAQLVLDGIKTATGSLLWSYEGDGKSLPREGDHWTVLDGERKPVCVCRTISVEVIPFDAVAEN